MSKDENSMKLIECYHCGNKTYMEVLSEYKETNPIYSYPENVRVFMGERINSWWLLKCPVCKKISFMKNYKNTLSSEYINQNLYPGFNYKKMEVPEKINDAFIVALKSRHVDPSICLIALRRTLEMICKDKGVEKGSLGKKLDKMVKLGIILSVLDSASYIVKKLGNEAAHADDVTHSEWEVKNAIEFTEQIINYVYVLPYRIKEVQSKEG